MSENPRISSQKAFDMLVSNQVAGSEMAGNGTAGKTIEDLRLRRRFRSNPVSKNGQGFVDSAGYGQLNRVQGPLARATASIEIADNDFSGGAQLTVGEFVLEFGKDVVIGGSAAATAANLATAIDNLPGYDGTDAGAVVNVEGRKGPQGNADRFEAKAFGVVANFTNIMTFAEAGTASPAIEGPEIS